MAVIKVLKNGCGGAENHDLILFAETTQLKMLMVSIMDDLFLLQTTKFMNL